MQQRPLRRVESAGQNWAQLVRFGLARLLKGCNVLTAKRINRGIVLIIDRKIGKKQFVRLVHGVNFVVLSRYENLARVRELSGCYGLPTAFIKPVQGSDKAKVGVRGISGIFFCNESHQAGKSGGAGIVSKGNIQLFPHHWGLYSTKATTKNADSQSKSAFENYHYKGY